MTVRLRGGVYDFTKVTDTATSEFSHGNRKIRGFFAGGNGGQVFMGVPELDLVIAFTGGNYSQAATFTSQRVFVPQYVLPAVTGP